MFFFLCILFMVLKMKLSVLVEQAMIEKEVFETLVNFVQPEQGRSLNNLIPIFKLPCPLAELGLQVIPGGEVRTPPEISFLEVVHQSSSMMNLLDKLFSDSLVPLIM